MKGFPLYKQHDIMQCGITGLAMICKHYGKVYSIDTLSQICYATTEGVSIFGISEAATSSEAKNLDNIKSLILTYISTFSTAILTIRYLPM